MSDILILVGTESGNAEMVAEAIKDDLEPKGHSIEIKTEFEDCADLFKDRHYVLVVCATHGLGELPDNIIPLQTHLAQVPEYLGHIEYGVIAMGDQTYGETFCGGGKTMDAILEDLGARRLGEILEIDACLQPLPDEEAVTWIQQWVTLLKEEETAS